MTCGGEMKIRRAQTLGDLNEIRCLFREYEIIILNL
jgi:hypothetical protein